MPVRRIPEAPEPLTFGECARCPYAMTASVDVCYRCASDVIEGIGAERSCMTCDGQLNADGRCGNPRCNRSRPLVAKGRRRRLPAVTPARPFLEPEQLAALLDAAGELAREDVGHRPYRRPLLATLRYAGLRVSELTALQWRDVTSPGARSASAPPRRTPACGPWTCSPSSSTSSRPGARLAARASSR